MKSPRTPLLLACTLMCACAVLHAEPLPGAGTVEGSIGLSSGLVTRGLSMGSGGPALQGELSVHGGDGWYAGVGAGTFGAPWSRAQIVQVQGRVGLVRRFGPDWSAQFGYVYYGYPLDRPLRRAAYDELALTLGWRDQAFVSVSRWLGRSWRVERHRLDSAVDLVLRQPVSAALDLTAGLGWRAVDGSFARGHGYGDVGLAWRVDALQLRVAYISTTSRAERLFGARAADRWTAGATWSF